MNIIHPPLYAGTIHISPLSEAEGDIVGGSFKANTEGIDHYKRFGYKGINMQYEYSSDIPLEPTLFFYQYCHPIYY